MRGFATNRSFQGPDALRAQIARDIEAARRFFRGIDSCALNIEFSFEIKWIPIKFELDESYAVFKPFISNFEFDIFLGIIALPI